MMSRRASRRELFETKLTRLRERRLSTSDDQDKRRPNVLLTPVRRHLRAASSVSPYWNSVNQTCVPPRFSCNNRSGYPEAPDEEAEDGREDDRAVQRARFIEDAEETHSLRPRPTSPAAR